MPGEFEDLVPGGMGVADAPAPEGAGAFSDLVPRSPSRTGQGAFDDLKPKPEAGGLPKFEPPADANVLPFDRLSPEQQREEEQYIYSQQHPLAAMFDLLEHGAASFMRSTRNLLSPSYWATQGPGGTKEPQFPTFRIGPGIKDLKMEEGQDPIQPGRSLIMPEDVMAGDNGLAKLAYGMTTPGNVALMAALPAEGPVAAAAKRVFQAQGAMGVVEDIPKWIDPTTRDEAREKLPADVMMLLGPAKEDIAGLSRMARREAAEPPKGPSTPNIVSEFGGVSELTVPEKAETIEAQLHWLKEGKRKAVLVTPGSEAVPTIPEGMEVTSTTAGTVFYDPKQVTKDQVHAAAADDKLGDLLGYGTPQRPAPGTEAGVVVVRGPEGTEKQAAVTDELHLLEAVKAAGAVADEGDTITLEDGGQVIEERGARSEERKPSRIQQKAFREMSAAGEDLPASLVKQMGVNPSALRAGYELHGDRYVWKEPARTETVAARLARENQEAVASLRQMKAEEPPATEDPDWDIPDEPAPRATELAEEGTPMEILYDRPPDILDWIQGNYSQGVKTTSTADYGELMAAFGRAGKGQKRGEARTVQGLLSKDRGESADRVLQAMHDEGLYRRLDSEDDLIAAMVAAAEARKGWEAQQKKAQAKLKAFQPEAGTAEPAPTPEEMEAYLREEPAAYGVDTAPTPGQTASRESETSAELQGREQPGAVGERGGAAAGEPARASEPAERAASAVQRARTAARRLGQYKNTLPPDPEVTPRQGAFLKRLMQERAAAIDAARQETETDIAAATLERQAYAASVPRRPDGTMDFHRMTVEQADRLFGLERRYLDAQQRALDIEGISTIVYPPPAYGAPDPVVRWFDRAIERTNYQPGRVLEGVSGAPIWLVKGAANAGLRGARMAYVAGRSLARAIAAGVEHVRRMGLPDFNERELRDWMRREVVARLNHRVQEELGKLTKETAEADRRYDQIPDAKGGKVIGTDIARELHPLYARDREGKIFFFKGTSKAAREYAQDRMMREASQPGQGKKLLVTGGGLAAGKSTLLTAERRALFDKVWDGTLRDTDWAEKMIRTAVKNGWDVQVNYVHRPIRNAMVAAVERARDEGRWSRVAEVPGTHIQTQQSIIELARRLKGEPKVEFRYFTNPGTRTHPLPVREIPFHELAPGGEGWHNPSESHEETARQIWQEAVTGGIGSPLAENIALPAWLERGPGLEGEGERAAGDDAGAGDAGRGPGADVRRAEGPLGHRQTGEKLQASTAVSDPVKEGITQYLYEKRSNATDEELARGIVARTGLDGAVEVLRDPPAALAQATWSKLLGEVTRGLAEREREARARGDEATAGGLAQRQAKLWDEMLPRITDMAQGLQALNDIVDMSPDAQVARLKNRLDRAADERVAKVAPEVETARAALDEGRQAGLEQVRQDPAVNEAARKAVDAAIEDSEEVKKAVVMELAGPWSQSPHILLHAKQAMQGMLADVMRGRERPVGMNAAQHTRAILGDLSKRAAEIFAGHIQGAEPGVTLVKKLQDRLGLAEPRARDLATALSKEWDRQLKAAQAKIPKRIATARATRERNLGQSLNSPMSAVDAAIRRQLDALNLKLGEVLKQEAGRQEQTGAHVAERIVQASGLTGEAADTLRTTLKNRWDTLVTNAQVRALERLQQASGVKVSAKVKGAFEKAVELERLGALTSERFYDVVKDQLKLKRLTQADAAELRRLVQRAQELPEGFLRQQAAAEVLKFTERASGSVKPWDIPLAIFYANILSGITTPAKIALENINLLAGGTVASFLARPREMLHPVDFVRTVVGSYKRGLAKGALQAASTLKTGVVTGVWEHARVPTILEMKPFGERLEPLNFWKWFTRGISTAHETTFKPAWELKQSLIAKDVARSEGLGGRALQQRVADLLANTEQHVDSARAQALNELRQTGTMSRLNLARRTREIIEQRREVNMPGSTEISREFALRTAYLNEPYGLMGVIAKGIRSTLEQARRDYPVLGTGVKTQIPFTTVVANILNEKLNWTPAGLARAAWSHKTGELYGREVLPGERAELYAKAIVGTVAVAALAELFGQHIHGNGPSDPHKRKQLQAAGWIPHSIEWDGRHYSYMNTPAALSLAVIGNILDWHRYGKGDDAGGAGRTSFALKATLNAMISQGMLDSLKRVFESIGSESTVEGAEKLERLTARTASSFVVPNLVQQVDRLFDPTVYDQTGVEAMVKGQVPFVRRQNKPAITVLGDTVHVGPFHYWASQVTEDPLLRTLADKQAWVPEPSRNQIIGDKKRGPEYFRAMTPDEYYDFVALSGREIRRRLTENLDRIATSEPDQARKYVQQIAEEERAKAKKLFE